MNNLTTETEARAAFAARNPRGRHGLHGQQDTRVHTSDVPLGFSPFMRNTERRVALRSIVSARGSFVVVCRPEHRNFFTLWLERYRGEWHKSWSGTMIIIHELEDNFQEFRA